MQRQAFGRCNYSRFSQVDGQVARKTEAPGGPARTVLPVHDEPDRGRTKVLRDELAVVESERQYPRERLRDVYWRRPSNLCRFCPTQSSCLRLVRLTDKMLEVADRDEPRPADLACAEQRGILRDTAFRLRRVVKLKCEDQRPAREWD